MLAAQWANRNQIPFVGITHISSYHGAKALRFCTENDIAFCALIRNPILAADSQYQERVKSDVFTKARTIQYLETWSTIPGLQNIDANPNSEDLVFTRCIVAALHHLFDVTVAKCELFRFEDYTSSYDDIVKLIETITRGALTDDHNVKLAYDSLGAVNAHRRTIKDFEQTWDTLWSEKQRQMFPSIWRHMVYPQGSHEMMYPAVENLVAREL